MKKKLNELSTKELESLKSDLRIQLVSAKGLAYKFGFRPAKKTPTSLVRDLKRQIARINTILNERRNI